ncbi:nuclease [Shewanella xiamenensis]|uniref:nuclease-related domain-containing protein n=1 Tax=Shewanella xiamenensis TaxID=332186 RepID=UPI0016428610|nr:nuclease-related domain-containing protein [Shewanella xiamenensis]TVL21556.1 nuclease [Shewanella xiamenensis]TVL21742.1 nuclease [Shewanella xiamenensis]TVL27627.1 nuclease [Shewanella xiamenensis]TVL35489.1 nuclease [Shewanella xiamenensis]TVP03777.1 nuclease [Shewanella xiamenensis]
MADFTNGLLSYGILLSGFIVTLGVMYALLKHRDTTVTLPVDREQLTRIPAYGLQKQIHDLQLDFMVSVLMGVLVVCLPFAASSVQAHITVGKFPWAYALMGLVGASYFGFKTWKLFSKLTKLRLGHTAEIATANELIGLQALGYQVFHDVQADGFNIDHLVIGKNGVFAIETKGRHKRNKDLRQTNGNGSSGKKGYEVFYKDGRLNFPSWTETKPIEQAERQAKWVSQWLTKATGSPVAATPALVFPGWYVTSQSKPPFPILNHKQLVGTIPKLKTQDLTQQQVDTIIYQVAQRCLSKSEVGK